LPPCELTFLGAGAVLGGVIERLAGTSGMRLRVLSRRPLPMGVERIGWEELAGDGLLVCGISCDEAALLRRSTGKSRSEVARANLDLLSPFFRHPGWTDRPVLMVTNPVEALCHRLWEISGNSRVYGFGASCDRERYAEILTVLAGHSVEPGELGGFHAFGPLLRDSRHDALLAHAARLQGKRSHYSLSPCRPSALEGANTWGELLHAWTATEFAGTKPPVQRAVDALTELLRGYYAAEPMEVSGLWQQQFVIGCLQGDTFIPADWAAAHPGWQPGLQAYMASLEAGGS
jgi:hypothetical protein